MIKPRSKSHPFWLAPLSSRCSAACSMDLSFFAVFSISPLLTIIYSLLSGGTPCLIGGWNATGSSYRSTSAECWNDGHKNWEFDDSLTLPIPLDRAVPMYLRGNSGSTSLGLPCLVGGMNSSASPGRQVMCLNVSNRMNPWLWFPDGLGTILASSCTGTSSVDPQYGPAVNPVLGGISFSIFGNSIAVGGSESYDFLTPSSNVVQWDPLSDWTGSFLPGTLGVSTTSMLNMARSTTAAFQYNGSMCVGGGAVEISSSTVQITSTECLSATGSWQYGPALSIKRGAHLSLQVNGWWCMMGGATNDSTEDVDYTVDCLIPQNRASLYPSSTQSSSASTLTWQRIPGFLAPSPLYLSSVFNINGMQCVGSRGDGSAPGAVYCLNVSVINSPASLPVGNPYLPWIQYPTHLVARSAPVVLYVTWPTPAPTRAPTRSPTITPTKAPTTSPTTSPTSSPTTSPTTLQPTTLTPTTLRPTTATPTHSPTAEPVLLGSSQPATGQVALVVDVGTGNGTLSPSQALYILQTLFTNLNLTLPSGISPNKVSISPSTSGAKTVAITLLLDDNTETGKIGTAISKAKPGDLTVPGYQVGAVTLNWPSVLVALQGLSKLQALILLLVLLLVLFLIVLLHWRQKALHHLPCLFGVATSLFSTASHAWFLATVAEATFAASATSQIAQERETFLPFFAAFTVAFMLPPLTNSIVMACSLRRVRQRDPDFQAWARTHRGTYGFGVLLSLFGLGNLGVVSSPVWGYTPAPMEKKTRASFSALGLWASVLEVPRLAVQVALAAIKTSSAAAAVLPLLLGSVFLASGFIQRCYFYGYTSNEKAAVKLDFDGGKY